MHAEITRKRNSHFVRGAPCFINSAYPLFTFLRSMVFLSFLHPFIYMYVYRESISSPPVYIYIYTRSARPPNPLADAHGDSAAFPNYRRCLFLRYLDVEILEGTSERRVNKLRNVDESQPRCEKTTLLCNSTRDAIQKLIPPLDDVRANPSSLIF